MRFFGWFVKLPMSSGVFYAHEVICVKSDRLQGFKKHRSPANFWIDKCRFWFCIRKSFEVFALILTSIDEFYAPAVFSVYHCRCQSCRKQRRPELLIKVPKRSQWRVCSCELIWSQPAALSLLCLLLVCLLLLRWLCLLAACVLAALVPCQKVILNEMNQSFY